MALSTTIVDGTDAGDDTAASSNVGYHATLHIDERKAINVLAAGFHGQGRPGCVENMPRFAAVAAAAMTLGRMLLLGLTPAETLTISKLGTYITTGQTVTLGRLGLYTVAGNGDVTLVAATANTPSVFLTSNAWGEAALDTGGGLPSTYQMVVGTRYMIGVLMVGGTAASLYGPAAAASGLFNGVAPKMVRRIDSQTDLPTSVVNGSLVDFNTCPYVAAVV